jgi:Protein of unknown function (DUF2795)
MELSPSWPNRNCSRQAVTSAVARRPPNPVPPRGMHGRRGITGKCRVGVGNGWTGYLRAMSFQVTEVQKALKGADYPMDGKALAELAEKNGAGDELVGALRSLREVDGPNGVMKELKGDLGGPTPGGNSKDEKQYKDVEGAAFQVTEVQKYLKGADYPMDGNALAELAKKNGAGDELVGALKGLREVDGPNGVMKELKSHLGGKPADA